MGRGARRGPGASPVQFPQILAVQSSPKSTVTQLAVHDYDFLHQDHSVYSKDLTHGDYYLLALICDCVGASGQVINVDS